MQTRTVLAVLLVGSAACAALPRGVPRLPPLGGESEVHVYLLPLAREADQLSFTVERIALRRQDGGEVPL